MGTDDRRAAQIILSIGSHRKKRILDPVTVAETLSEMVKEFPRKEIARRYGIADRTLRVYFKLLKLPTPVKNLVRSGSIGQDLAYRLTLLDDPRDQISLANAIVAENLVNKEVRAIVQTLKRRNPDMAIDDCVQLAVKYRPRVEEDFLIITKMEKSTIDRLKTVAEAEGISQEELLKRIVSERVPQGSISSLRMENGIIAVSLDKVGDGAYRNTVKQFGVKDYELMDVLVRKWMEKHADC